MFEEMFESIVDEVVSSLQKDLNNPETIEVLRETLDDTVIRITGINIRNPFIYPHYSKVIEKYQDSVLELLGLAVSNPPESIDTTAEFLKEEVNNKVDSLANRLKQRLNEKEHISND